MTREEAIKNIKEHCYFASLIPQAKEALDMAIKALEQEPCDCIYRAELLKVVDTWDKFGCDANSKLVPYKDCYVPYIHYDDVVKAIKGMPSVQPKTEWIPVSERLPEEHLCNDGYIEPSDYVLVWGDHGNYGVSRYWGNRRSKSESPNTYKDWVDLDWAVQKPIAWMPLPEPYKAESENQ